MTGKFGVALCLLLAGCQPPVPVAKPHYVVGAAWQADGVWHYPQDSLELNTTGIATIYRGAPQLTTDGEVYDATALTAAQQTLALPAVARITNLDNGLQVMVRINDRGPTDPGRIIAVTPRVAALLQFGPDGLAPVRLDVLADESRAVAGMLASGGGPTLEVGLAPVGAVQQTELAPPDGARQAEGRRAAAKQIAAASETSVTVVPQRLPETVTRVPADPGRVMIGAGSFSRREFADLRRIRLGGMAARIDRVQTGRTVNFRVMLGPYNTVNDADSALRQAIDAGVTDAKIVVE